MFIVMIEEVEEKGPLIVEITAVIAMVGYLMERELIY